MGFLCFLLFGDVPLGHPEVYVKQGLRHFSICDHTCPAEHVRQRSWENGIYSIYSNNFNWATGYADLLNSNSTCGNKCHFADAPIERLDIWVLN